MIININLKPFIHQNIYQEYYKGQDYIVNLWHQQLHLCILYTLQFQKVPFILPQTTQSHSMDFEGQLLYTE